MAIAINMDKEDTNHMLNSVKLQIKIAVNEMIAKVCLVEIHIQKFDGSKNQQLFRCHFFLQC